MTAEQIARRRERNREYQKNRRARNAETIRAADRARRTGNETYKARKREKYHVKREEILARHRAKYAENPQKYLDYNREIRKKNPEMVRRRLLKKSYGITLEQFEEMRSGQNGCCAICREPFTTTPQVDHCHATGAVRSLLCGGCNSGIARFRERPESLESAAQYLRSHSQPLSLIKQA